MIQGRLISLASALKQDKQKLVSNLLTKIQTLERSHKRNLGHHTHQELTETCKLLLEELDQKTRKKYTLSQKIFYEHSNKSGHLLAQALLSEKAKTTVHQLQTPLGNTLKSNPDIAQAFKHFCANLYNLLATKVQTSNPTPRSTLIQNFLEEHFHNLLASDNSTELHSPITTQEWDVALKNQARAQVQTAYHLLTTEPSWKYYRPISQSAQLPVSKNPTLLGLTGSTHFSYTQRWKRPNPHGKLQSNLPNICQNPSQPSIPSPPLHCLT